MNIDQQKLPIQRRRHNRGVRTGITRITTLLSMFVLMASVGFPLARAHAAATATVIAGLPADGPLVDNIPATSAQFWNPADVTTTSDGTIYVADKNHNEVRSIAADGIIRAAFGNGTAGCASGSAQTLLYNPASLTKDEHDNIYVATGCGQIVEFTPGNPVGTVVAGHYDVNGNPNPFTHDGMDALAVTVQPGSLTYDPLSDSLYFYDSATLRVLRLANGTLSAVAGTGVSGYSGDGGQATSAQFSFLGGMLFANDMLYISDSGNCRVRAVPADGTVTTVAGDGTCSDLNDTGLATAASIQYPGPLAMDANDVLYISGSLSGSIFAYDTDAKTITPVIGLISNTSGLNIEPSGNLLALHSGIDQQLFRITGLPSTTPPSDGKQHGRVTTVSWSVSPTTALWTMDTTVKTTGVSCPAVAVVTAGTWQKRTSICGTGQTAPKSTNFSWKVFNSNHAFDPGSNPTVTAYVAKSDAAHYGDATTTLSVPTVPALVGVGDSYLSGHHQIAEDLTCQRAEDLPASDTTCGLVSNDPAFSWVTLLAGKLNAKAPAPWRFAYDPNANLLARSGATTAEMFTEGQIDGMVSILQPRQGTWNVVAFDGGANDINFRGALKDFYQANLIDNVIAKPWALTQTSDCPDSELLFQNLYGPGGDIPEVPADAQPSEPIIAHNLQTIVNDGQGASNTTRFVNMLYPYVTKTTNVCSQDHTSIFPPFSTFHGSVSVVNGLNDAHRSVSGNNVLNLDLANGFGDNPLAKLQLIRYYGYPHPNETGQEKIAALALKLLK